MGNFVSLDNGKPVYREHAPSGTSNSNRDPEQVYYGNISRIGRMMTMRKENPALYTEKDIKKEIAITADKYGIDPEDYSAEIDLYIESQGTSDIQPEISNIPNEPQK